MTFDVASVRQSEVGYSYTVSGFFTAHTSTFRATNFQIENLISMAYGLNGYYQISGVPGSFQGAKFNVQAKADDAADQKLATLTGEQQWLEQRHMLLVLLAERFHLQAHWETKEGEIYNLVSKNRSKMRETSGAPPSEDEMKRFHGHAAPAIYQRNGSQTGYDYVGHACPIGVLADALTAQFGRPVIDKTGLAGKYDFVLSYHRIRESEADNDATSDPNLPPPLETALQDQLGLKLEAAKGPVSHLVIDHLEKPSEN
jgi:uncharacterized protein (TIGR03435 family)